MAFALRHAPLCLALGVLLLGTSIAEAAPFRGRQLNPYAVRRGRKLTVRERRQQQDEMHRLAIERSARREAQRPHLPAQPKSALEQLGLSLDQPPGPARARPDTAAGRYVAHAKRQQLRSENAFGRNFAEIRTGGAGVADYLREVGKDTIEVLFNPHTSAHGHIMLRVGERLYDLGNTRAAKSQAFVEKVQGYDRLMGAVFSVTPEKRRVLMERLEAWVGSVNENNLPVFDAYSRTITLERTEHAGPVRSAPPNTAIWKVKNTNQGIFDAKDVVFANLRSQNGTHQLVSPSGVAMEVQQTADGKLSIAGKSCTTFPTAVLAEIVPELGIRLSKDSRKLMEVLVTRADGPRPELVTVYRQQALELPLASLESMATETR